MNFCSCQFFKARLTFMFLINYFFLAQVSFIFLLFLSPSHFYLSVLLVFTYAIYITAYYFSLPLDYPCLLLPYNLSLGTPYFLLSVSSPSHSPLTIFFSMSLCLSLIPGFLTYFFTPSFPLPQYRKGM